MANLVREIQRNRDNYQYSCAIMLDLSKAFDTVNHSIPINKLEKYGVRGNTNKLMKSYLSNCTQILNTNNAYSGELNLLCGLPQGSILGSLLFFRYINNLPKASKFMTRLFADDTALILSDSNINSLNEQEILSLQRLNNGSSQTNYH